MERLGRVLFLGPPNSQARAVIMNEPLLLVGETGCGKTSAVQHLANLLNQKLVVLNLNQQVKLLLQSR